MRQPFGTAPSLAQMQAMADAALAALPPQFAAHLGDIVTQVQDFAEEDVLAELELESAYELSGLYSGIAMTEKSVEHSGAMPDRVFLYRIPILLEWAERGDVTLEHLVHHVLVHEIGHHFGLSDEDMHALEDMAG
ncbi:metallopeptidase family protein [Paraurantiacibacter namhicola]|uniref:Possibl zinc metallo-peptidase n=1 Tax=Paraurantiacibacter namhicola TaxID=645517 RepID=A0A1C7D771_9SPHN|nr:metallopeptidase family protein [Paraurantiacibacter namhicola]ANU07326.1 Possibl zinc metallo-peptidase [Paraurantiacibacter namhicola]